MQVPFTTARQLAVATFVVWPFKHTSLAVEDHKVNQQGSYLGERDRGGDPATDLQLRQRPGTWLVPKLSCL